MRQRKLESDADRCCGVARCHSGGFLLRIMPPSWHPVPACTPRLYCRRAVLLCRNDGAASILDFRPRLGNRCSQEVKTGAIRASILDFKPRLANRCSQKVKTGANRASILDFKPRLANRCSQEVKTMAIPPAQGLEHCAAAEECRMGRLGRGNTQHQAQKKSPDSSLNRDSRSAAATYSPTWCSSTIGASELNFSVRDGKRWILTAITAAI